MADILNFSIEEVTLNFSVVEEIISIAIAEETLAVSAVEEVLHFSDLVEVISTADPTEPVNITVAEEILHFSFSEVIQIIGDNEVAYAKRVDFVGDIIYKAEAAPGTLDDEANWRIHRLIIDTANEDDIIEEWVGGRATFDQIWNDHLTLGYS